MPHSRSLLLTALLTLGFVNSFSPGFAAQTLTADEKALAAYKLTMPNVKKAMAVVQAFLDEEAKDPKVQEHAEAEEADRGTGSERRADRGRAGAAG